jgi:hypothetical protein
MVYGGANYDGQTGAPSKQQSTISAANSDFRDAVNDRLGIEPIG